jgi:tetratricopeptide (TPR) repeat protein
LGGQASRISVRIYLCLSVVLALSIAALVFYFSAQVIDNEPDRNAKGLQLIKEKKYAEAETLFQAIISAQEKRLEETKSAQSRAAGAVSSLLASKEKDEGKLLAVSYNNLATVLYEAGRFQDAEPVFEKAINTYRQYFGRQHGFVAGCLKSLAAGYYKQGKYVESERYYLEELELQKQLLKPDNLSIAVTANNLAAIYQKLGDSSEAEKYFEEALVICQNFKPTEKEADRLADILNNLAVFYEKSGAYEDARTMVDRALELENKRSAPEFSVDKVRSLLVLASIARSGDLDLDACELHYKDALGLVDDKLGGRADLAAEVLAKYGELLLSQRRFQEAEPVFDRSLKACLKAHGLEHPAVAERLSDYAQLMRRTDRNAQAESMLRRALAIQEKTIGVDTVAYLSTVHRLASVLQAENRCRQADRLYREVLPKLKSRLGPWHPFVADTMDNWAVYVEKCGDREAAEELRANARLIRRKLAQSLKSGYTAEPR